MLAAPLEESSSTARPRRVRQRLGIGLLITLSAVAFSACGGGERQDADEPEGEFPVQVVSADFPSRQQLAQNTDLTLGVENSGERTIPDLAITIFTSSNTEQPDLAIPFRPVWILEEGYPKLEGETAPAGAEAAQTDTFSFGPLAPNQTRRMVWNVTAVQAGTFTVHYRVAAGLQGKAKAVTADGSVPEGEFVVRISSEPPQTRVTDSGQVVPIKPGEIIGQAGDQQQKSELNGQ
jgi:hypothetical protein